MLYLLLRVILLLVNVVDYVNKVLLLMTSIPSHLHMSQVVLILKSLCSFTLRGMYGSKQFNLASISTTTLSSGNI